MLCSHPGELGPCFLRLARSTAQHTASSTARPASTRRLQYVNSLLMAPLYKMGILRETFEGSIKQMLGQFPP